MEEMRMLETIPIGMIAALMGLASGLVLGLAARLGDFCTLGALEAAAYGSDQTRLRLWGIVLAVAILGTQGGAMAGLIDLSATIYHALQWNVLGSIIGGLVFGYGMALAGNCGFGALVRFGGGDMRSLVVVVVMGIFGFIALSGPLAPLRVMLFPQPEAVSPQGIVHDLGQLGCATGNCRRGHRRRPTGLGPGAFRAAEQPEQDCLGRCGGSGSRLEAFLAPRGLRPKALARFRSRVRPSSHRSDGR
jgi:uncharacterized membrane protein YedE/YeeE